MSRIGLNPITVPGSVTVTVDLNEVTVKGPKGELKQKIARELKLEQEGETLTVSRPNNQRRNRSQHGLARTLLDNMVQGVTQGHSKNLEIHGVGYRLCNSILTIAFDDGEVKFVGKQQQPQER